MGAARCVAVVVEAKGLAKYHEFAGLMAFGRFEATRIIDGRTESDIRIFVLSPKLSSQALLETVRDHCQIETRRPWQLDVSFGEDAARSRKDNGPADTAVIAAAHSRSRDSIKARDL
jgi:predicted transposase YbfD/YdcC